MADSVEGGQDLEKERKMLGKKMIMGLLFAAIISMAMADEQKPQPAEAIPTGRQMNWNSQNFLDGSASMMAPQAKSSSGFQSFAPQSLESDINRDGSYSAASSGGGDYGYEASPDSSYGSGSSYERNGYDYQKFLPTTSRPFYSRVSDQSDDMTIPNAYLRGIPRNQLNQPDSYLSSLQSGRQPSTSSMSPFYSPSASSVWFGNGSFSNSNKQHMTNRAGYDEDIPLGGVSSSTSNYGLLSGTTMRNSLSRQDDFSYGTVNGPGLSSIPPAGVGYGFASPGYSSNYVSPSYGSSYSSYGTPAYSYGGGYGANNYGYSPAAYSSYGSSNRNSPLYSNFGGGGAYGYGGGYGYGSPSFYKAKPRKGFWDWWKGKDVIPYTYGASIGGYGGAGYDAYVPYDHDQFDPGFWKLSKYAFKSMFRSMFKPIFKWLPLCSPFNYYYDREGQA